MPNSNILIRNIVVPRPKMFVPTVENCPIPLEWLDITRNTTTSLSHNMLHKIDDYWTHDARNGARELDEEWTGHVQFDLLHKQPEPGKEWQKHRLTVIQPTTRPPTILVEAWRLMSDSAQKKAIAKWKIEGPKREKEYIDSKKLKYVLPHDFDKYDRVVPSVLNSLKLPTAPAMICF